MRAHTEPVLGAGSQHCLPPALGLAGCDLGLGCDVVEIARFSRALCRSPRLAQRLFSDAERTACTTGFPTASAATPSVAPIPCVPPDSACAASGAALALAARFAAKEAAVKALGEWMDRACHPYPSGWSYRDIEVVSYPGQAPRLLLHGVVAQACAQLGIRTWHVSLSHDRHCAFAVVVATA